MRCGMKYLESYLNKIIASGNPQLAESIQKSSDEIGDTRLRKFSYVGHEIGLLFGNVQSGKTGQVFGIISKAADMGFPAFVLLLHGFAHYWILSENRPSYVLLRGTRLCAGTLDKRHAERKRTDDDFPGNSF